MTLQAELVHRALSLPDGDRAELARQLILSLDKGASDEGVDAAWEAEIERRASEVDRGEVKLVDWRESVQRIEQSLKKRRGT